MSIATISKREISIPRGDKIRKKSTRIANAMALELLNYGIKPEQSVLDCIASHKKDKANELAQQVLKMFTIGDVNPPLFRNWEARTSFTFTEMVVQLFGYALQISGNDLDDPSYMATLKTKVVFKNTKTLSLAVTDAALVRFNTLVSSNVALDRKSLKDLITLAEQFHANAPAHIRSDEARIAVVVGAVKAGADLLTTLSRFNCRAADVLRYAAAIKDFEGVKLPSDVKYASIPWSQRRALVSFLRHFDFSDLCEEMGNNREAWFRFFRHFHIFQQSEFRVRDASVVAAAFVSVGSKMSGIPEGTVLECVRKHRKMYDITDSGNIAFRTFASRVQAAVDAKDMNAFREEITQRPGYLFRNLATLSHVASKKTEVDFINLVRGLIDTPKTSVLLSLIQIDVNAKYRVIDTKGDTRVMPADYHPVIGEIQRLAELEIYRRHGFNGRVQVQEKLRNKVVPFLATNVELDRGTRSSGEDKPYLYFLMHWVQSPGHRTDLDHSYMCFDKDWKTETVYFGNQANSFIAQSGDITNAPAPLGGTEYGKIKLNEIPDNVRYIVPIINVYSGQNFAENQTAYAGFMFSDNVRFSLQRKHVRYDLSQPAQVNVPFVIDVKSKEIIIVDFNNRNRNGMTAHSSADEIRKLISAVKTKKFMTMQRFADLLSGDEQDVTSLKITEKGSGKDRIAPDDLSSLVS